MHLQRGPSGLWILSVLQPILALLPDGCWQYVDDVFLASDDPPFLFIVCCYAMHLLGKAITAHSVSNSPGRVAYALASLWALRCYRLSYRALQRLLGYFQWLLAPSSLYSTFLASAYAHLQQRRLPKLLPRNIWLSLLVACLGAAIPFIRRPLPHLCVCRCTLFPTPFLLTHFANNA